MAILLVQVTNPQMTQVRKILRTLYRVDWPNVIAAWSAGDLADNSVRPSASKATDPATANVINAILQRSIYWYGFGKIKGKANESRRCQPRLQKEPD